MKCLRCKIDQWNCSIMPLRWWYLLINYCFDIKLMKYGINLKWIVVTITRYVYIKKKNLYRLLKVSSQYCPFKIVNKYWRRTHEYFIKKKQLLSSDFKPLHNLIIDRLAKSTYFFSGLSFYVFIPSLFLLVRWMDKVLLILYLSFCFGLRLSPVHFIFITEPIRYLHLPLILILSSYLVSNFTFSFSCYSIDEY